MCGRHVPGSRHDLVCQGDGTPGRERVARLACRDTTRDAGRTLADEHGVRRRAVRVLTSPQSELFPLLTDLRNDQRRVCQEQFSCARIKVHSC